MDAQKFLTQPQAAAALGIVPATLRRWLQAGALPHYRIGKKIWLDPADVQAFIMRHRVSAPEQPGEVAISAGR